MNDKKKPSFRQIMAIVALAAIVIFVIIMCICMAVGSKELMMASMFCLVIVPIIAYCMIIVYDKTHPEGSVSIRESLKGGNDEQEDANEEVISGEEE